MSGGNKWTAAEDAILIAGFGLNLPWPDLLERLPGRNKDTISQRAASLRQSGVHVPYRPNPNAKSEQKIAEMLAKAKRADAAREASDAAKIKETGWHGILFTDDPQARRDRGTPRCGSPLAHSPCGCSASWTVNLT